MRGDPPEVFVFEADNGRNIKLNVDTVLVIALPINPSTGYKWEIEDLDEHLLEMTRDDILDTPSSKSGEGKTEFFRLWAIAPGTTTLNLIYHRPFETNVPPVKLFSITVTVIK